MGETLGISVNVFEKVAREKDRKERLKKFDEWQKIKIQKQKKIKEMKTSKALGLEASSNGSLAFPEDLDDPIYYDSQEDSLDDICDMKGSPIRPPRSPRPMTSTSLKSLGSRGASIVSLDYSSATPSKKWNVKALERRQDSLTTSNLKSTSLMSHEKPLAFSKIQSDQTSEAIASASEEAEVIQPPQPPTPLTTSESEPQTTKMKQKLKCGGRCACEIL